MKEKNKIKDQEVATKELSEKVEEEVVMIDMPKDLDTSVVTTKIEEEIKSRREKDPKYKTGNGMVGLLFQCFKTDFVFILLWALVSDLIAVANLFCSSFLIAWLRDEDGEQWVGYAYSILL